MRKLLRKYKSRPASTKKENTKNYLSFFISWLYFSELIMSISISTSTLLERNTIKKDPNLLINPVPGKKLNMAGIVL